MQTGYSNSKQTSNSSELHASIRPVCSRTSLPKISSRNSFLFDSPMRNSSSFRVTSSSTCFLRDSQVAIGKHGCRPFLSVAALSDPYIATMIDNSLSMYTRDDAKKLCDSCFRFIWSIQGPSIVG